ncbi:SAM-dependent methyltransferase [Streptomyces sp. SBT349]|uniref:SAM-dependent methyltransferase n=1 Tax=Streptomyces sp. SBT349 TaxID=1580539 RepID=UPI00066D897B|nr:SAM-dependent methyltransferase [Streptomyces sp. SBT349]
MTDRGGGGSSPSAIVHQAHSARMYDYFLGGKTHYAVDRAAAEEALKAWPTIRVAARENRAFMHRSSRYLAREAGIRQFLDIGTGIPTEPNLHQVVQGIAPEARVVYADRDPLVLSHADALMRSTPEGRTTYLHADVTAGVDAIFDAEAFQDTIDLSKPVALSLLAILHFVPAEHDTYGIVRQLLDELPSGSSLSITHVTADFDAAAVAKAMRIYAASGNPVRIRARKEIERFFDGLDLVGSGLEPAHRWRPDAPQDEARERAGIGGAEEAVTDGSVSLWAGVGIKP